ncbi:MAG: aminotransferase class III-fold pyridoxal phosphate-dependent enzyme [Chloroflexota bacterium]|nr:aminotransferase class III-fold pyridoxal phosphate-dependent enzyme [Chloroflexota bacterium]
MAATATSSTIQSDYEAAFAGSQAMHERARKVISGGITHDGRYLKPFPPYIVRAQGAKKWDVDGHELIDYAVGHGSLIFGHNDPDLTAALQGQAPRGTHFGAGHEGEVAWAEQVVKLVPSAEQVRFTASGTESTLLAMRIARGYTEKTTILKFEGHFHGWQDYALKGEKPPFEKTTVPGIPRETLGTVAVLPANDLAMLEERLVQGDVAAVIIEPSGASWATIPLKEDFLGQVRLLTQKYDAVLIFDEVITGFRWAPGGAQERFGVTPDLTTMAKIVAGGMPGGAVAGTTDLMQMIAFRDEPGWNADRRVPQAGTYNANPLAAAAGLACLRKCEDPSVQQHCDALAQHVRSGLNEVFDRLDVPIFAWGESSIFHIALGQQASNRSAEDLHTPEGVSTEFLKSSGGDALAQIFEVGMLLEGVHLFHSGGFFSTAHTSDDVDRTIAATERVVGRMREQGLLG